MVTAIFVVLMSRDSPLSLLCVGTYSTEETGECEEGP